MLSIGGTIGALIFGFLTTKIDARPLLIVSCLVAPPACSWGSFLHVRPDPDVLPGRRRGPLTLNACITGLYTVAPESYPSALRTTGTGAAIGIARVGATLAPILTGYLLSSGWTPTGLYTLAGATALSPHFPSSVCAPTPPRSPMKLQLLRLLTPRFPSPLSPAGFSLYAGKVETAFIFPAEGTPSCST